MDARMIHNILTAGITAAFVLAGCAASFAFQYPVAGPDNDPDYCSSRSEPLMFCVTPPLYAHCQALVSEETPLYLGYRYVCEPAPQPAQGKPAPATQRAP